MKEEIYKTLFERSAVPTLCVVSEKIELANRAAVSFFEKLGVDDLKGTDFKEIWPSDTKASAKGSIADLERLKPGEYELTLLDGNVSIVEVTSLGGEAPVRTVITIDDVTWRNPEEEELAESNEKQRNSAESAGYGVAIVPTPTEEAVVQSGEKYRNSFERDGYGIAIIQDAKVKYVDLNVARMCGYTVDELLDTDFSRYVEPTELPKINDNYKRRMDGEYVPPMYETVIRHKDGSKVYVDVNALVVKYHGEASDLVFVRNITERKRAERALKREREAFRLMAEASVRSKVLPDLCQKVLSWLVETMGFESGFIRLYDAETGLLQPTITVGLSEKEVKGLMRLQSLDGQRYTGAFVEPTTEAIFAPDVSVFEASQERMLKLKEFGIRSLIYWPVLGAGQQLLGVMQLGSRAPKEISDEDRSFFKKVAGMFATVLEHTRVEEALADSERTYRSLYEATLAVAGEMRLEDVSRVIVDRVTELINAVDTTVYLTDRERGVLMPVYSSDVKNREAILAFEIPVSEGLSGRVAATGTGAFINIGDKDDYAVHIPSTDEAEDENESVISVPMFDGGDVLGVITSNKTGGVFGSDDLGRLTAFARQVEITVKRAREVDSLRESEEKLRVIFETAVDSVFIKDTELRYIYVNPATENLFGIPVSEIIGHTDEELFGKDAAVRTKKTDYRVLAGETIDEEDVKLIKDVPTTLHVIKVPMYDESGGVFGVCGIVRDITERMKDEERVKKSLREKEVLLKETHHRIKNNLQIISSILDLQAGYVEDENLLNIFRNSQNRVRSMALIHEKLYQSESLAGVDLSGYVRDLIRSLFTTYRFEPGAVALNTSIGDVFLDIDTSVPLALIINELVSNSLEHAFPDGGKGHIRVDLYEDDDGRFKLTVADNGVGLPKDFDFQNVESLGLQLVKALVEQLDGTIELDSVGGTRFDITFSPKRRVEA